MKPIIAYCGLQCHTCPILLATREPDAEKKHRMREQITDQIEQAYGIKLTAEEITDCDGCSADGRLYAGCKDCKIRPCARERGVVHCGFCDQYACEKLEAFFAKEPESKKQMDALRNNMKKKK